METEEKTIEDFLSSEPSEPSPVVEQPAEPAEDLQDDRLRDEHGRFVKKGEEESASPAPAEEPPFEHAAVKGERTRRQEAERQLQERDTRLATLEQQLQQLQQPKEPPPPPPTIWDDEQGWQQHFGDKVVQQASFNAALNMSEMLTRREHRDDFDQMKTRFLEMAEQNPAIVQQALSDPDPWAKAYAIAKNAATMAELGAVDLSDLEAKIEARLREEMAAESSVIPQPTVPLSLTGERNVGTRSGPAWSGPKPLDQLLG